MAFTLLRGYSFTILNDGSYVFNSDALNGIDASGVMTAFVADSINDTRNSFDIEEIAMGVRPVGAVAPLFRYDGNDTFAFTVTTANGATLSVLEFLREDRSAGEMFILQGARSNFAPNEDGFRALIDAMETTPPVPLPVGHILDAAEAPARIYDSVNYRDLSGHATQLVLSDDADNILRMGDGADTVQAGGGDDWVSASGLYPGSRDALFGNAFTHQHLSGGDGNDTMKFVGDGAGVMSGGSGDDRLFGGASLDWLFGNGGDDVIFGHDGNDTLVGGAGYDRIYGGSGDDELDNDTDYGLLRGGAGDDRILSVNLDAAGNGFSRLFGDAGNDEIDVSDWNSDGSIAAYVDGGAGDDHIVLANDTHAVVRGGTGADVFEYQTDVSPARIQDFEAGVDVLDARDLLGWADFATLISNADQKAYGVRINGMENDVYLKGVTLADLTESDFIF